MEVGSALTLAAVSAPPDHFRSVETGILIVDAAAFIAFAILALRADRFWPIWAAAFGGLGVLGHLARWYAGTDMTPRAYYVGIVIWSYPILALIAIGSSIICDGRAPDSAIFAAMTGSSRELLLLFGASGRVLLLCLYRGGRPTGRRVDFAVGSILTIVLIEDFPLRFQSVEVRLRCRYPLLHAFVILALRADRFWPIWATALLASAAGASGAMYAGPDLDWWLMR